MKNCELCKLPAKTYCESDQASLCWDCDSKVHGANFLVARHSRCLLCEACQSLTPWKASGAKLGHTVSVCESCVNGVNGRGGDEELEDEQEESEGGNDHEIDAEDDLVDDDDDDDDDDDEYYGEDEDVDEDGDNQVVPWSSTTPPPAASSSSSEGSVSRFSSGDTEVFESVNAFSLKRMRENVSDLLSQDDLNCSSSQRKHESTTPTQASRFRSDGEVTSADSWRPLKARRTEPDRPVEGQSGSKSAATIESLKRFHERENIKLTPESGAVDNNSSGSPSRTI